MYTKERQIRDFCYCMAAIALLGSGFTLFYYSLEKGLESEKSKTSYKSDKQSVPDKTKKDGMSYGPKTDFGPSFNFRKGKFEFGPSMHFGPRW